MPRRQGLGKRKRAFSFTNTQLKRLLVEAVQKGAERAVGLSGRNNPQTSTSGASLDLAKNILSGEKPEWSVTGGLPIDLDVFSNLPEKILAGKYVNLAELLIRP